MNYSNSLTNFFLVSIIENNNENALKYGSMLIDHQFNEEFWIICFNILVEYIHIFMPNGPEYFYTKYKEFTHIHTEYIKKHKKLQSKHVYDEIILPVVNKLIKTYKQHISLYISPEFNKTPYNGPKSTIRELFINLNELLTKITAEKQANPQKIINQNNISKLQSIVGQLLIFYNPQLDNQIHEKIVNNVWNIILTHSKKLIKPTQMNIHFLAKLYHKKLLNKLNIQSLILLNALFYFIYVYNYDLIPAERPSANTSKKTTDGAVFVDKNIDTAYNQIIQKSNKNQSKYTQKILNNLGEDIQNDPFHMLKVGKLLQIPSNTLKKKKMGRNNDIMDKKNLQIYKKFIHDTMYNFEGFCQPITFISDDNDHENNDKNDQKHSHYKIISHDSDHLLNYDQKLSKFNIIKMQTDDKNN